MAQKNKIIFSLLIFISGSFLVFGQSTSPPSSSDLPEAFSPEPLSISSFSRSSSTTYNKMNADEKTRVNECFANANATQLKCFTDSNSAVENCFTQRVDLINAGEAACITKAMEDQNPNDRSKRASACQKDANEQREQLFLQCKTAEQPNLDACKAKARQEVIDCVGPIVQEWRERIKGKAAPPAVDPKAAAAAAEAARLAEEADKKKAEERRAKRIEENIAACNRKAGVLKVACIGKFGPITNSKTQECLELVNNGLNQCIVSANKGSVGNMNFFTTAEEFMAEKKNYDSTSDNCRAQSRMLRDLCLEKVRAFGGKADMRDCNAEVMPLYNKCLACVDYHERTNTLATNSCVQNIISEQERTQSLIDRGKSYYDTKSKAYKERQKEPAERGIIVPASPIIKSDNCPALADKSTSCYADLGKLMQGAAYCATILNIASRMDRDVDSVASLIRDKVNEDRKRCKDELINARIPSKRRECEGIALEAGQCG